MTQGASQVKGKYVLGQVFRSKLRDRQTDRQRQRDRELRTLLHKD